MKAINSAFQSLKGEGKQQQSPFEETPFHFKEVQRTRKRMFTGELKASDVAQFFRHSRSKQLVRAAIAVFFLADIALLAYLFF